MRCQTVTEKLSFFVHHELDEHTHGRIAQHLESCAPCQQALVEYQRLAEIARKMAPAALSEQALQKAKKNCLHTRPNKRHLALHGSGCAQPGITCRASQCLWPLQRSWL